MYTWKIRNLWTFDNNRDRFQCSGHSQNFQEGWQVCYKNTYKSNTSMRSTTHMHAHTRPTDKIDMYDTHIHVVTWPNLSIKQRSAQTSLNDSLNPCSWLKGFRHSWQRHHPEHSWPDLRHWHFPCRQPCTPLHRHLRSEKREIIIIIMSISLAHIQS